MFWYFFRMDDFKDDPAAFQQRFLEQWGRPDSLLELFGALPEVYFFAKDRDGRFVLANPAEAQLHGFRDAWPMIGRTDFDFHPRHLAEQYVAEDRRVMESRAALPNQMWLVHDHRGQLKWYISSKTPLFDMAGEVIGVAGVMRDFERTEQLLRPFQEMEAVLAHVLANYGEPLETPALAALVHLSVSQFDRRFKQLFQVTPQDYILRVRLNAATQALLNSNRSMAEIAAACGFYDQSYFTKQFRRWSSLTPSAYRAKYAPSPTIT